MPDLAALHGDDAAGMNFDLAGVIVDGSSIYSASELLPSYRRYLGQEVSVSDLYKISGDHGALRRRWLFRNHCRRADPADPQRRRHHPHSGRLHRQYHLCRMIAS